MSLHEIKSADSVKSKIVIFLFRMSTLYTRKNVFFKVIGMPFVIANKIINEWLFCVEIPHQTRISSGLVIYHPHCIVINPSVKIGKRCIIRQNVTIGNIILKDGTSSLSPEIGDDVEIGANVIILGNITIGDGCRLGAGAVVNKSLLPGTTVVGFGFREINNGG